MFVDALAGGTPAAVHCTRLHPASPGDQFVAGRCASSSSGRGVAAAVRVHAACSFPRNGPGRLTHLVFGQLDTNRRPARAIVAPQEQHCGVASVLPSTRVMKYTAYSLNHHEPGELALDGYRRGSLATIGHRARGGLRVAALLAASTLFLVHPGQAMAQETRAETIRQEQADKKGTVTPPELNSGEKTVLRLERWGWINGKPHGVYPVIDSIYPGGGFAAGLGARKPFGDDGDDQCHRRLFDQQLLAGADGHVAADLRLESRPGVADGSLRGRARREVLRHRPGLGQGRQDVFRLHPVGWRRTSRLRSQPVSLGRRRRQLHRRHNRLGRHRAVD